MTAIDKILRRLAALAPNERKSILAALPSPVAHRLHALLRPANVVGHVPSGVNTGIPEYAAMEQLATIPASTLARLLNQEPPWVIHAALFAHEWDWRTDVLGQLTPRLQRSVNQLAAQGAVLPRSVVREVLSAIVMATTEALPASGSTIRQKGSDPRSARTASGIGNRSTVP